MSSGARMKVYIPTARIMITRSPPPITSRFSCIMGGNSGIENPDKPLSSLEAGPMVTSNTGSQTIPLVLFFIIIEN